MLCSAVWTNAPRLAVPWVPAVEVLECEASIGTGSDSTRSNRFIWDFSPIAGEAEPEM